MGTLIAAVIGAAIVAITLYSAVVDRTRDYGMLKAIGARRGDLFQLLLVQAWLFAVAGTFLGASGFFLIRHLHPNLPMVVTPTMLAGTAVTAFLSCTLASLAAVRRVLSVACGPGRARAGSGPRRSAPSTPDPGRGILTPDVGSTIPRIAAGWGHGTRGPRSREAPPRCSRTASSPGGVPDGCTWRTNDSREHLGSILVRVAGRVPVRPRHRVREYATSIADSSMPDA